MDTSKQPNPKKMSIIDKNKELENSKPNATALAKQINELTNQNKELTANNAELNAQVEQLTANNAELEDMLKRRVAEFENYKRRTDKEKMDLLDYGSGKLLAKFVDILDDLANATDAAKKSDDTNAVVTGLEMIAQKTAKLFADEGVTLMDVNIGDEFNVEYHEALMTQPSDLPEGCITMILQKGYMYKDKVIRYAKVATSAGS
ncbi:MAG: nucleotide exchange factor GrpE [Ignavibacteria bacterium]|nr:nucleotide exchange factor GrpE [Ignavibacteria bacterium]